MSVDVDVSKRLGDFRVDAKFSSSGRLTALFGASGSGKSSIINMIAGLLQPDAGRISIDGRVLFDRQTHINVPSHRRRIGYVFQEARLFPHLSVRQNLAYGQWFASAESGNSDIARVTDLLGLDALLGRMPGRLSGGEKQRVAIGRALLSAPRILLMDEPLASLDQGRRTEIIPYIERLRDEFHIPVVYVSHSVAEVARLAIDIAVITNGRVSAFGPTPDIMQRLDLMPAEEKDETGTVLDMKVLSYDERFDMTLLGSAIGEMRVPGHVGGPGKSVRLRLRARDVIIANQEPRGLSALNLLRGRISSVSNTGPLADVRIDCTGTIIMARITRQSSELLKLVSGMPVYAIIKTASIDSTCITT